MNNSLVDHMNIFFSNLTWFYLFSSLLSFSAVIGATAFTYFHYRKNEEDQLNATDNNELKNPGLQAQYKLAKQKITEKRLMPVQRNMEEESESQTLLAVMELLQKHNDTFDASTMDELKEQMNLYRHQ